MAMWIQTARQYPTTSEMCILQPLSKGLGVESLLIILHLLCTSSLDPGLKGNGSTVCGAPVPDSETLTKGTANYLCCCSQ